MNIEMIFIVDESGSMASMSEAVVKGFNDMVEEQRKVPGNAKLSLCTFNETRNRRSSGKNISDPSVGLSFVSYCPGGSTALYDAIGTTLNREGERIRREAWADKVIVVIMTDGHENSSKLFTKNTVSMMCQHAEEHGWQFIYTAANLDAAQAADAISLKGATTMQYAATADGALKNYRNVSASLTTARLSP